MLYQFLVLSVHYRRLNFLRLNILLILRILLLQKLIRARSINFLLTLTHRLDVLEIVLDSFLYFLAIFFLLRYAFVSFLIIIEGGFHYILLLLLNLALLLWLLQDTHLVLLELECMLKLAYFGLFIFRRQKRKKHIVNVLINITVLLLLQVIELF